MRSSSCGLRQNRSNAWSNSDCCSCRSISTDASAARKSSRLSMPTASTASSAAITFAGPDRQPGGAQHAREMQDVVGKLLAPEQAARAGARHAGNRDRILRVRFGDQPRRDLGRDRADVVLVLEQRAQRVGDRLGIERDAIERDQRLGPVERLGDARRLEQVHRAQALRERDDLARQALAATPGTLRRTIASSRSAFGIVDPVVEAAPLDRVVDFARAVRRDDDDRRLCRLDRRRAPESSPGTRRALRAGRPRTARRCDRARRSAAPARRRRAARAPAGAGAGSGSARRKCRCRATRGRPSPAASASRISIICRG